MIELRYDDDDKIDFVVNGETEIDAITKLAILSTHALRQIRDRYPIPYAFPIFWDMITNEGFIDAVINSTYIVNGYKVRFPYPEALKKDDN